MDRSNAMFKKGAIDSLLPLAHNCVCGQHNSANCALSIPVYTARFDSLFVRREPKDELELRLDRIAVEF